jgi:tRNA G46 methylase TrmB
MHSNSSPVISSQNGVHEQLQSTVARHAFTEFKKPIASFNQAAFDASMAAWRQAGAMPLILDAGCGVGLSTMHLAKRFPDHFVIGVDQSADRLARNTAWEGPAPSNQIRVRADLVDYWRLMLRAGVRPQQHTIFYPNPWPKIGQLSRRWHGHAVFPTIVALGGQIECRSNWRIYIEEFALAVSQLTGRQVACTPYMPAPAITPFEKKYLESGHQLWRCQVSLDNTATPVK